MAALAFVKRTCRNKFNVECATLLYNSLVRSNLEFASTIWSPYHKIHRNSIESVQKQAVIYLNQDYVHRSENNYVLSPYETRCTDLKLTILIRRRVNAAALFIYKIIRGIYQAPDIRSRLNLYTGVRSLRNPEFIRLKKYNTDYGYNSPFNQACRAFNHAVLFIDPTISFHEFKSKLLRLPDTAFGDLCTL